MDTQLLQSLVGKTISSVEIHENCQDQPVSFTLSFTDGDTLYVSSGGDECGTYVKVSE